MLAVYQLETERISTHRWDSNAWRTTFRAHAPVDKHLLRRKKAQMKAIAIPVLCSQKSTQQLLVDPNT